MGARGVVNLWETFGILWGVLRGIPSIWRLSEICENYRKPSKNTKYLQKTQKNVQNHNDQDLLAPFPLWWPRCVQRRLLCAGEHIECTKGAKTIQRGPNLEKAPV